jgi:hypothetical protein
VKKFLSKFQGLGSFCIAIIVFWSAAPLIQQCDPSAGTYDRGSLHGLILGASAYLLAVWLAWFVVQMEWPSINEYIDTLSWLQDWRSTTRTVRLVIVLCLWCVLFIGAVVCLLGWR